MAAGCGKPHRLYRIRPILPWWFWIECGMSRLENKCKLPGKTLHEICTEPLWRVAWRLQRLAIATLVVTNCREQQCGEADPPLPRHAHAPYLICANLGVYSQIVSFMTDSTYLFMYEKPGFFNSLLVSLTFAT